MTGLLVATCNMIVILCFCIGVYDVMKNAFRDCECERPQTHGTPEYERVNYIAMSANNVYSRPSEGRLKGEASEAVPYCRRDKTKKIMKTFNGHFKT